MRVVEEPFLTRGAILSILRPGEVTTERPFRTLRSHDAASSGLAVAVRSPGGQVLGHVRVYSALNADAARAYRLDDRERAQALAARAGEIERSQPARRIHEAMADIAARMPLDPSDAAAPVSLRRYAHAQRKTSWRGLDAGATAREWLSRSTAWLTTGAERAELLDAIVDLDRAAAEARADVLGGRAATATTFFGVVSRMDDVAAEVDTGDGTFLVPRDDLDRQGLAAIDQPIALLREQLPGGGSYLLPLAAVALDEPAHGDQPSPWDPVPAVESTLPPTDLAWIERELAREPTAVPVAPLPLS